MMIRCFLLAGILVFSLIANAQPPDSVEHGLGIKAGGNLSIVDFTPTRNTPSSRVNFLSGFEAGLTYKRVAKKHFGIQIEVNFVQKGWEEQTLDEVSEEVLETSRFHLNYIEMPFLSHVFVGRDKYRLHLNLGIYANYVLGGYSTLSSDSGESTNNGILDSSFNEIGYGLLGGVGIGRRLNMGFFQIEGRYQAALGNVFKKIPRDQEYSRYMVFSINLAYFIEWKRAAQ